MESSTTRGTRRPLLAAAAVAGTALLLAVPGVQAFLPTGVRRGPNALPHQSTLIAAAGLLSRSPSSSSSSSSSTQPTPTEIAAAAVQSSPMKADGAVSAAAEECSAMSRLPTREEKAKEWFATILAGREAPSPIWQAQAQDAVERLSDLRAPTRKDEAWRFTDLSRLYGKQHRNSPLATAAPATLAPELVKSIEEKVSEYSLDVCAGQILVYVDGVLRPEVSRTGNLSAAEGWQAGSIHSFKDEEDVAGLMELLGYVPELGMRHTLAAGSVPFVSLNSACMTDVACLVVQPRAEMPAPVQFMFVSTSSADGGARVSHPRLLVLARKRSTARFVQTYIDLGDGVAMANGCTTVFCERRAVAEHLHLNEMGPKAQLFDAVSVGTKKMASYKNVFINVGGETARINFQATMNGTMGNVETQGLTVTGEEQELDIHSFVHQLRKKGLSNMYQVNIVAGESHCVFKGRMKLEPKAREVKADQLIRSIMLTGTCTVDAMPTLEVSSGDVDCTHGATVADIDENQAFYLQSRGISRRQARQVLMMAQAKEVYGSVPDARLHARLSQRLYDVCPQDEGLSTDYKYLSM